MTLLPLPQRLPYLTKVNYATFRGYVRHQLAMLEWMTGRFDRFFSFDPKRIDRLVFVCLGNINRSAFAHAVATAHGAHAVSIGLNTTTGAPAFVKAKDCAGRFGISLAEHRATDISDYQYREGDLLLTMEARHAHQLLQRNIPERAISLLGGWSYPRRFHLHDPHLASEEFFITCFTLLESAVIALIRDLEQTGSKAVGGQ